MSRFGEGDGEEFAGQYELWRANAKRAIEGRRGQRALADLEAALLALPTKRLIAGHIAHRGEVCAIGALVTYRREQKGEDRDAVLTELAALTPALCECGHTELDHEDLDGPCSGCVAAARKMRERFRAEGREVDEDLIAKWYSCSVFVDAEESEDGDWKTIEAAKSVGVSYVMAWELAWSNDEAYRSMTPEQRYARTLAWVRAHRKPETVGV